ncbi:hypothetical protein [Pseudomonas akapageensis]|uniref:hypothetical protein n=1 Tax=Pseudomonas akapageensis TaxID=2609961 RepID=UPI001408E3AA|nr:hypothetical protein [Pseudomonas akapageensis]
MGEHFLEDHEEEFPVNSCVHCGQTPYRVGFEGATIDDSSARNPIQKPAGRSRNKFLPRAIFQAKK